MRAVAVPTSVAEVAQITRRGRTKRVVRVDYDQVIDLGGIAHIELCSIGPAQARRLLERNYKLNRGVRRPQVAKWVLDMIEGRWQFNGASICFDMDGVMIDGQHRLVAVIESDTEQDFLVVLLPHVTAAEIFSTIDSGCARTHVDIARSAGFTNYSTLSAIANCVCRAEYPYSDRGRTLPKTVFCQFVAAHPGIQDAAAFTASLSGKRGGDGDGIKGWLKPAQVGTAYYFWSKVDQRAAAALLTRMATDDRDQRGRADPACVLRKKLVEATRKRVGYSESENLNLLQRAFSLECSGLSAKRAHFQVPDEARVAVLSGMAVTPATLIEGSGLTHKALAKRLGVGDSTISHWNTGKVLPTIKQMSRLVRIQAAMQGLGGSGDEGDDYEAA